MTFRSLFISLVLFAAFAAHSQQSSLPYNIELQDVEGNIISSSEILLNTKFTLIEFWSFGCKPCIVQLNSFSENIDELTKRDTRIIAISQFEWNQKEADQMTKLGIEAYFDVTGKYYRKHAKFLQASVPLTIILNDQGKRIYRGGCGPLFVKGLDPNDPEKAQKVFAALDNNPSLLDVDLAYYYKILE